MDFTNLKNCLNDLVEKYNTPGVDCMVYWDHELVFRYFTGMRDLENGVKMNGNELYLIFSMTKMLTCVSALQLFEKGAFRLEDPISGYLPEFARMKVTTDALNSENAAKIASGCAAGEIVTNTASGYAERPITVKNLFTMGGGFDYSLKASGIQKALEEGKTSTRELVGAMSETVLGFEPGTRFRYSLCHDVLGALIEVWSGQKLGDYMQDNIFTPLGMENTFFGLPTDAQRLSRMAARYIYEPDGTTRRLPLACMYNLSDRYQSGGAGLTSCTQDYAVFLDALACGGTAKNGVRILSEETVRMMKTNQLSGQALEDFHILRAGYGYGLGVRTHMDRTQSGSISPVGEFGWDGAAGAFSMVDTDHKLSLTYFQHVHGWDVKIQNEIRNALYTDLGGYGERKEAASDSQ